MKNQPLLLAVIFLTTLAGHIATADVQVELIGQWDSYYQNACANVAVEGRLAYLGCGSELDIVDISWPSNPSLVGWAWIPSQAEDWSSDVEWVVTTVEHVAVQGNYAYLATLVDGEAWYWWSPEPVRFSYWNFDIVDISDPCLPVHVGQVLNGMEILDIDVAGNYAYVVDCEGLTVLDVSIPAAPHSVGRYNTIYPRRSSGGAVLDKYAYVICTDYYHAEKGLLIIDVSNPTQPICVGECHIPAEPYYHTGGLEISGSYAYVANGFSGLQIIDVSNPAAPISVGGCDTSGWAEDVEVSGSYAYVADWGAGVQIIDVSNPAAPICVGGYDTPGYAQDVAVSGGYIYVADGDALLVLKVRSFTEKAFRESTLGEALISSEAVMNDVNVTGDFESTLDFTGFEIVTIATGPWAGKGFSKGQFETTLEGIPYEGSWQGVAFLKPEERKIYLNGSVTGEMLATVEGYLTESVPGSGIYDQYQATWKIGRLGNTTTSAIIQLNGNLSYQSSSEFPETELYILQSNNVQGTVSGDYSEPLSTVLTHIRVADPINPYYGQGFSIISYTSNSGSGQGWTYDEIRYYGVEIKGLFTSPLFGIASGTLDERHLPRTLSLTVERVDLGLPPMADLEVKTWGPGRVSPGETIDYLIEVRNDGLKNAENTSIIFALDPLLEYVSSTYSYHNEETNEIIMDLGMLEAKGRKIIRVTAKVPEGLAPHTFLENSIGISTTTKEKDLSGVDTTSWRKDIQSGDIILEHNEKSIVPGYWKHGGGIVYGTKDDSWTGYREGYFIIESLPNDDRDGINQGGVRVTPIENWDYPFKKEVVILRVEGLTQAQRDYIVDFWKNQIGKEYENWFKIIFIAPDFNSEARKWYCIELIAAPYHGLGIDFDIPGIDIYDPAIAPQEIYDSDLTLPVPGGYFNYRNLNINIDTHSSEVITARDPSVKYGPEGNVLPGQKLNYRVEYENEGQGIAFGVYFTDTLDEDLNDSTLEIGPVIDVNTGVQIAPPGTYNPATRTISWFAGEVGPSQGGYTDFNVCVKSDAADGTEIINYATVYFPSVPEETRTNGVVSIVSLNQPPVAIAGPDQTVERTSIAGANVQLDGSDSNDPEDDPLSYEWTWTGGSASGVNPTVVLPLGLTTVTLTVSDGKLADTDIVDISVVDTTPPTVNVIEPEANLAVQDGITLKAVASDLSSVDKVYFCVREPNSGSGVPIGQENLAATLNGSTGKWEYNLNTTQLPDGYYVVLAKGVDIYGNVGWSEVVPFSIRNWAIIKLLPATPSSKAGRTMPVKFSIRIAQSVDPAMPFVYNEDLEIRIYKSTNPSVILQRSRFGTGSTAYRIDIAGEQYITNFKTSTTPATYVVEVWRPAKNFKVGSFTFKTVK